MLVRLGEQRLATFALRSREPYGRDMSKSTWIGEDGVGMLYAVCCRIHELAICRYCHQVLVSAGITNNNILRLPTLIDTYGTNQ